MKNKRKIILYLVIVILVIVKIFIISNHSVFDTTLDMGYEKPEANDIKAYQEMLDDAKSEERTNFGNIAYVLSMKNNNYEFINKGQFYHPPMNFFIIGNILKVVSIFTQNPITLIESIKYVPIIYFLVILFFVCKITSLLEIKNRLLIIGALFVLPIFIIMSGCIGTDMALAMFFIATLYFILKWDKEPNVGSLVMGSIFLGLTFLSKLSGMLLFIIAFVVFLKKISKIDFEKEKDILKKYLCHGLIFIIITGIIFTVYEIKVGFRNFVITYPAEILDVSGYSIIQRFGIIFNPFVKSNYNIWNEIIFNINGIFANFTPNILSYARIIISIVLMLLWTYYFIKRIIKKEENIVFLATYISFFAGYMLLNISYPYSCSMNTRYILVPIILGIIDLADSLGREENKFLVKGVYLLGIIYFISVIASIILMG